MNDALQKSSGPQSLHVAGCWAEIHHPPWPLQVAEADIETNTMLAQAGLETEGDPLMHYARRQDVVFWTLEATGVEDRGYP